MRKIMFRITLIVLALAAAALPLTIVHGAGGRIEGRVTDPKGAVIVGATITVTDPTTNQTQTATTDQQGHYKVEGLNAGSYIVTVFAKGFNEARIQSVNVTEGRVATADVKLEIAPVQATVPVEAGAKANSDPMYLQLRQIGKDAQDFGGPFATVNNLVLQRDAATFTLRTGEVYFSAPIEGRVTTAVFIGDGEISLVPPTDIEKHSLSLFIDEEKLTEPIGSLVIRFTDKTFDEIKASASVKMGANGPQAEKARDLYRSNQQLLRKELHSNAEIRTLSDIYAPQRPGYFTAFIGGKKHSKLIYWVDPLGISFVSPEEVALVSRGEGDGGIWTAFHFADEYRTGKATSSEDHRVYDITHHEIDGGIRGTNISATDRVTFRALVSGRIIPFSLYRTLRVSSVRDEQGRELNFIQEPKDDDPNFAVIMPQSMETGKSYSLTIQYAGDGALSDSGGGNYILGPRETWYPNNGGTQFGDRAIFDITFRYPKGETFVATGAPTEPDKQDGNTMVAKWSSGKTELAVAGFNYGRFKKKELADKDTGYNIEFYANEEVPDELKRIQTQIEQADAQTAKSGPGRTTGTTLGAISTTTVADSAIADAKNSTLIYNTYFGKLPYTRLAMSQQPAANFGQAWPTLVFMPYMAFLDETQRSQLLGTRGGTDNFWRYVAPHEISHQWWGHVVGWDSYHDQWMSEGFAEFSASLYVQFIRRDIGKFHEFWNNQRDLIITARPATRGKKPYTVGPVTQGYRLNSGRTGNIAQFMIYPKGAYILQMIRMMFYSSKDGDQRFQAMMHDFVKTYFNRDISTEDFKHMVEKHMSADMDLDGNGRLDWFFNDWVYGTEIPSYRFEYQLGADGASLSGQITQSGVSKNFKMMVPIYLDFGKGWTKIGSVTLIGNNTFDLKDIKLPAPAKRAAICALDDILALSIQNGK
jgi:Carboxypeptidase regulatory-like domain/Peptidase family M1 domain